MSKKIKKKFIPHDIENDYNIYYSSSDGRYRAYNKKTKKVVSYPRLIMENQLGRYLNKNEDVHHQDEDKSNNDITNFEIIEHRKHVRQHNHPHIYYDIFKKCPVCGVTFQWTDKQQRNFHKNQSRTKSRYEHELSKPVCSRRCGGIYGRKIQKQIKNKK